MYPEQKDESPISNYPVDEGADIRKVFFALRRKLWIIILAAILAGVGAFFISKQVTPIYQTTTDLLVIEGSASQSDYQDVLISERLTRTISDMMLNQDILQEVIDLYALDSDVETLKETIEVGSIHDTQLITVTVEGPDPTLIANIANSMVSVFIDRISNIQTERYSSSIESLSTQLKDIENILQGINNQIIDLEENIAIYTPEPDSETDNAKFQQYITEKENLEAQAIQYQQIHADLLTSYEQTRLAETQSSANIIQINEAVAPIKPIRPILLLNIIIAVAAAIFLTSGIIFILGILDDTINTPDQIEKFLGLPVLGVIFEHQNSSDVISQSHPLSPVAEAFRSLRTSIQHSKMETLLITSPSRGAGKSLISSNLAVILAQSGLKTLLVDVDLRRPSVHKYMSLPNEKGLATLLLNPKLAPKKLLSKTKTENLMAITSGDLPPNPSELLGSPRMASIVKVFSDNAEAIVFDAPPVLPVADAVVMAEFVDGILLIMQPGVTTISEAKQTVKNLRRVNANIIGVIFNGVKMKGSLYYYYYRKGYGKYQSDYFMEMK